MTYELSAKSISISDFKKICRTCFSEDNLIPIFNIYVGDLEATELLKACTSLEIDLHDALPQQICTSCIDEIYRINLFKRQCIDNDTILRLLLQQSNELGVQKEDAEEIETHEYIMVTDANIDDKTDGDDDDDDDGLVGDHIQEEEECIERAQKETVPPKRKKPRKVFKCTFSKCNKIFVSKIDLDNHRKEMKHRKIKAHPCRFCYKSFTSSKLKQHLRIHTKEKPYKCNYCYQAFSSSGNLRRHIMIHTGERPHVCETCGKGFIQATSLTVHLKTHLDPHLNLSDDINSLSPTLLEGGRVGGGHLKFICNFCGRGFKRSNPFNAHIEKHTTDKMIIRDTEVKDLEVREYVCENCNRAFKTKHLLKAHQLTHGEKSFLCSECGKGFVTKASLQSHLKVHTGEKPYTCLICKKSFAHVSSFDAHMLIHSGKKPHKCTYCYRSFTQLSHLTYHLRTHSGEKPYVCSYCGKKFALKGNLTVHIRTHTGETPYLCNLCGKGYHDSSSLKKHQRHHKEQIELSETKIETQQAEIFVCQEDLQL